MEYLVYVVPFLLFAGWYLWRRQRLSAASVQATDEDRSETVRMLLNMVAGGGTADPAASP